MIKRKYSLKSIKWYKNSLKDFFIQKRNQKNLRSRAWFKLQELDNNLKIFKKGMCVIDLGSSPGGWSEYIQKKIGNTGRIIACDRLPMKKIPNVFFILGDIQNTILIEKIVFLLKKKKCDVITSDISPNISGFTIIDNENFFNLCDIVLTISIKLLSKKGYLIFKLFQGVGFQFYIQHIKKYFLIVKIFKLKTSRKKSREVFIVANQRKI
ncbi:RlmE family RNA methyltransferase [Buchnera aphidicola]|uniref:RlmE family RNA methyltransferase n=1 Tax=Buchnera aphidicola TaxID=9 RepID=UPI0031B73276